MAEVKSGEKTTEFAEMKSNKVWSIVAMALGMLMTVGAAVADSLGADTKAGIIVGAAIAVAAIMQRTLTSLGYMKSRTVVKATAIVEPEVDEDY